MDALLIALTTAGIATSSFIIYLIRQFVKRVIQVTFPKS